MEQFEHLKNMLLAINANVSCIPKNLSSRVSLIGSSESAIAVGRTNGLDVTNWRVVLIKTDKTSVRSKSQPYPLPLIDNLILQETSSLQGRQATAPSRKIKLVHREKWGTHRHNGPRIPSPISTCGIQSFDAAKHTLTQYTCKSWIGCVADGMGWPHLRFRQFCQCS